MFAILETFFLMNTHQWEWQMQLLKNGNLDLNGEWTSTKIFSDMKQRAATLEWLNTINKAAKYTVSEGKNTDNSYNYIKAQSRRSKHRLN